MTSQQPITLDKEIRCCNGVGPIPPVLWKLLYAAEAVQYPRTAPPADTHKRTRARRCACPRSPQARRPRPTDRVRARTGRSRRVARNCLSSSADIHTRARRTPVPGCGTAPRPRHRPQYGENRGDSGRSREIADRSETANDFLKIAQPLSRSLPTRWTHEIAPQATDDARQCGCGSGPTHRVV
jgi:hypothetical protein